MPKTTKTTRKASSASTKKSGLKRRFDLANKKVQFFVVIGIVAILGGGYFTVKSFASQITRMHVAAKNQTSVRLSLGTAYSSRSVDCKLQFATDTVAGKNNIEIINARCPSAFVAGRDSGAAISTNTSNSADRLLNSGTYKACAFVKGQGTLKLSIMERYSNRFLTNLSQTIQKNGEYNQYCTAEVKWGGSGGDWRKWLEGRINVTTKNDFFNVQNITLIKVI